MLSCDASRVRDFDTETIIWEKMRIVINKVYAENNNCLPVNIRNRMQTSMIDLSKFKILYGCNIKECGTGDMVTNEIQLSNDAFDENSCGCLEATLLHEFLHATGILYFSPEDERKSNACELKCFGCAIVRPGNEGVTANECCDK